MARSRSGQGLRPAVTPAAMACSSCSGVSSPRRALGWVRSGRGRATPDMGLPSMTPSVTRKVHSPFQVDQAPPMEARAWSWANSAKAWRSAFSVSCSMRSCSGSVSSTSARRRARPATSRRSAAVVLGESLWGALAIKYASSAAVRELLGPKVSLS